MIPPARIKLRPAPVGRHSLPSSLHPVLERALLARGVSDARQLDLRLQGLHPPDELSGLEAAGRLLAEAVCAERDILIVGDFDADGATGTAVAMLALRAMGATRVRFQVPNRFEFGYGLTTGLVAGLRDGPPDVLVTVDAGIACNAGVAMARELGCEVVVTDHHLPGEELPPANAIVNPNCPGDPFPSKALAGVGVVFYLMSAVRSELRQRGWFGSRKAPNLAQFLDLVALGTVADLVPLDHNNRVLVGQGIERVRRGQCRPGLLALLRVGKRDYRNVVAADLGFAVGPRLNAAGRLEDMGLGIRCLLTQDHDEAARLAERLDRINRERRQIQEQMQAEAMAQVDLQLGRLEREELPLCVCLHDDSWHQGIVGLVASRVKDALHRPVVALAPETAGSETLKGSGRSVRGMHMRDLLAHVDARNPGLMSAFGGHAMAAGLTIDGGELSRFTGALEESARTLLGDDTLAAEIRTDGELPADSFSLAFAESLRELGPWGQQFPEPLWEGDFEVLDQRVVGGAHLKLILRPLAGHDPLDAIAFGKLPEDLPTGNVLRALFRLDVNHFRGERSCQLIIEHLVDTATG